MNMYENCKTKIIRYGHLRHSDKLISTNYIAPFNNKSAKGAGVYLTLAEVTG